MSHEMFRHTEGVDIRPWDIPEIDRFLQASCRVRCERLAPPLIVLQKRARTQNNATTVLEWKQCALVGEDMIATHGPHIIP